MSLQDLPIVQNLRVAVVATPGWVIVVKQLPAPNPSIVHPLHMGLADPLLPLLPT